VTTKYPASMRLYFGFARPLDRLMLATPRSRRSGLLRDLVRAAVHLSRTGAPLLMNLATANTGSGERISDRPVTVMLTIDHDGPLAEYLLESGTFEPRQRADAVRRLVEGYLVNAHRLTQGETQTTAEHNLAQMVTPQLDPDQSAAIDQRARFAQIDGGDIGL